MDVHLYDAFNALHSNLHQNCFKSSNVCWRILQRPSEVAKRRRTLTTCHTPILLLFQPFIPGKPRIEPGSRGFGWCWVESPHLRADLWVNMRIPTLTGCQYKAIYGTPWRIDPLGNRQFLCSAGHQDLQKTKSETEREMGREKWGDVIRIVYYRPSTHAYSDALCTFIHTVICSTRAQKPDTHSRAGPHIQTGYTPTRSASSNTADMDAAQEREDVKVVLEAERDWETARKLNRDTEQGDSHWKKMHSENWTNKLFKEKKTKDKEERRFFILFCIYTIWIWHAVIV